MNITELTIHDLDFRTKLSFILNVPTQRYTPTFIINTSIFPEKRVEKNGEKNAKHVLPLWLKISHYLLFGQVCSYNNYVRLYINNKVKKRIKQELGKCFPYFIYLLFTFKYEFSKEVPMYPGTLSFVYQIIKYVPRYVYVFICILLSRNCPYFPPST